ncbi:hypothetical protein ID47_04160 [Candidatus Paracaedibacter acanthamoebae]|uniref:Uncharacterized protein n=1 Tax=Candidatus Odyssella acanthamoebae TaxID=91604 RepID=A0A077ASD3_9PROT|nr:hypothetical protein ID47_04160 [Candidatus Paracaedibacter acanthamoebae]
MRENAPLYILLSGWPVAWKKRLSFPGSSPGKIFDRGSFSRPKSQALEGISGSSWPFDPLKDIQSS